MDAELPRLDPAVRATPIALPGPGCERIEITISLRGGWEIVARPRPIELRNPVGEVVIAADLSADGALRISRRIRFPAHVAPAEAAEAVAAIANAWRDPASRSLILRRRPATGPRGS